MISKKCPWGWREMHTSHPSYKRDSILVGEKCIIFFHPEVFLGKGVLKICSQFTGEHPCQIAISIKLLCIFSEQLLCKM